MNWRRRQGAATFLSPASGRSRAAHSAGKAAAAGGHRFVLALCALVSTATGMSPLLARFVTPDGFPDSGRFVGSGVEGSREMPRTRRVRELRDSSTPCRPAFARGGTALPTNHLPNRGHPERSEGSFATGAQSKDPVSFTMDVPRHFHEILRLRYARVSASAPLPMNLSRNTVILNAAARNEPRSEEPRGMSERPPALAEYLI